MEQGPSLRNKMEQLNKELTKEKTRVKELMKMNHKLQNG